MLAQRVSDLIGPSSGAFCTSCISQIWYVVIRILLDTYYHISNLYIQLVKNAPEDGPVKSETCRANIRDE